MAPRNQPREARSSGRPGFAPVRRRTDGRRRRSGRLYLARTWFRFGCRLLHLGRNRAAVRAIRRSLELYDQDWTAWAALAEAETASGRVGSAIVAYHQVLALQPDLADGWYNLAWLYQRIGYSRQAADAFGQSLRLSLNDRDFRAVVGLVEQRTDVAGAIPPLRTYLLH